MAELNAAELYLKFRVPPFKGIERSYADGWCGVSAIAAAVRFAQKRPAFVERLCFAPHHADDEWDGAEVPALAFGFEQLSAGLSTTPRIGSFRWAGKRGTVNSVGSCLLAYSVEEACAVLGRAYGRHEDGGRLRLFRQRKAAHVEAGL